MCVKAVQKTSCCGKTSSGASSTAALHRRHRGYYFRCSRAPFGRAADRTGTWNASWCSLCTAISASNPLTARSRRGPRPGGSRLCRPDLPLLQDVSHRTPALGPGGAQRCQALAVQREHPVAGGRRRPEYPLPARVAVEWALAIGTMDGRRGFGRLRPSAHSHAPCPPFCPPSQTSSRPPLKPFERGHLRAGPCQACTDRLKQRSGTQ